MKGKIMKTATTSSLLVVIFFGIFSSLPSIARDDTKSKRDDSKNKQDDAAVKRAKREARMLDDIYKNGIVLITKHYVNEKTDLAAGEAFKKLFEAADKNGWHKVRLLDATGEPYNDDNAPQDEFEKSAVKALVGGKPIYDEIIKEKGKRYLRRATAVPVVMKKCVMCHSHYADVKEGTAIGALSYKIPILD